MNQLKHCSHSVHSSQTTPDWVNQLQISLNPHGFFVEFLTSINYDHSLLLDFLISNETNFLPYFHMYLRHLANDWCGFISVVNQGEEQQLSKTVKPLSSNDDDICDVRMNGGNVDSVGNSGVVVGGCDDKHANNGGSNKNGGSDGEDGNMRDVDSDMEDVGSVGSVNIGIDDGDSGINDHGNGNVSGSGGGNSVGDDDGDDNDMGDVGNKGGVNIGVNHGDGGGNDGNGNVGDVGTDDDGGTNVGDDMGDVGSDGGDMGDVGIDGRDHGDNGGADGDSGSSDGNSNMGGDIGTDSDGGNSVGVDDSDDGNMGDVGVDSDGGAIDGNSSDGRSFSDVSHGGDDGGDDDINGSNDSDGDSVDGRSHDDVVMCNISTLQKTLTCLIRLRYVIERMSSKALFPYPVTPLVKLMEYIETLYERER